MTAAGGNPALAAAYLSRWAPQVEQTLGRLLPPEGELPQTLHRAMRYATLGGGKRLRAALAVAGCETVQGDPQRALPVAAALEMIHAYSLVHDDLPAMDDDDWRRGKPSCHRAFGEAMAILAGDALQSLAFEVLARLPQLTGVQAATALAICGELAEAVGSRGMAGGQAEDLLAEGQPAEPARVASIHARKTARLMAASLVCGGLVGLDAGAQALQDPRIEGMRRYGLALGLAFQVVDDVLDEVGDPGRTGKGVGRDRRRGKATFPAAVGVAASLHRAQELAAQAHQALQELGDVPTADLLGAMVALVVHRQG